MRKKNIERAEFARVAVGAFMRQTGMEVEEELQTPVIDLVADLMHLCEMESIDWRMVLRLARAHYQAEQSYLTE